MKKEVIKFWKDLETELKLLGYSNQTIKAYIYHNQKFIDFLNRTKTGSEFQSALGEKGSDRTPQNATNKDLKAYLAHLVSDKGQSPASVNLALSAIRFFYSEVLEKDIIGKTKHQKPEKKIPVVLTKDEIKRMLDSTKNKKHKLLIGLLYCTGMRVSEAVNIRVQDFLLDEKKAFVKYGKGKKERFVTLSNNFIKHLQSYVKKKKIKSSYLFTYKGKPISTRQALRIVKNAASRANITKKAFCHALRSSFATHLLDSGIDIRQIQEFLGHSSLETTQRYTKVSSERFMQIKNPHDTL